MVGVSSFWVVLGEIIGVSVSWFFMAERFKKLSDSLEERWTKGWGWRCRLAGRGRLMVPGAALSAV